MRLGVILDRFEARRGGAEAHTAALMARALAPGDDVVLACLEGEAPAGARTLRIPAPRRRPARDRVLAEVGEARLREAGADVVLALRHVQRCDVYLPHGGLVEDARRAQDAARRRRPIAARLKRALSPKTRYFAAAERALLDADAGPRVVCVSHGLAQRIRQRHPAAAARVVVVPNGVDASYFSREPWEGAGRDLRRRLGPEEAYVGLLLARQPLLKGVRTAVQALAAPRVRALAPAFHLVVAGGPVPRAVRRLARRLGVRDRLHLHPGAEDPRTLYAAADVLVHPTFHDPCSLVCLEALAMGLPVVTTPANGVRELMGMRGGIVLESAGDPEALAVALGVLADEALRQRTAEDARALALRQPLVGALDRVLDVCRGAAGMG